MRNFLCFAVLVGWCMGAVLSPVWRATADPMDLDIEKRVYSYDEVPTDAEGEDVYERMTNERGYDDEKIGAGGEYEDLQSGGGGGGEDTKEAEVYEDLQSEGGGEIYEDTQNGGGETYEDAQSGGEGEEIYDEPKNGGIYDELKDEMYNELKNGGVYDQQKERTDNYSSSGAHSPPFSRSEGPPPPPSSQKDVPLVELANSLKQSAEILSAKNKEATYISTTMGPSSNEEDMESSPPPPPPSTTSNFPSNNLNVKRQQRRFNNDTSTSRDNHDAQQTYKGDVRQNSSQMYNNLHRKGRNAAPYRKPTEEGGGGGGGRGGFSSDASPQQPNYRRRGGPAGREGSGQHNEVNSAMYSKEIRGGGFEDSRYNTYGGRPTNTPTANDYKGKVGNEYDYGGRTVETRPEAYEYGYYTEGILADESEREDRPREHPRDMQRFHSKKNRRYSPYGGRSEDKNYEDSREFDMSPSKQNMRYRHIYGEEEEEENINKGYGGRRGGYRGGKGRRRRRGGRYDVDDIDVNVNRLWRNLHDYNRAESSKYDEGLLPSGHPYLRKQQEATRPPVTTNRRVRVNLYMALEGDTLALLNPGDGESIPVELSSDTTLKDIAEWVPEFVEFDRSTKDIEWVDIYGAKVWSFNKTMAPREYLQDYLRRENIADSTQALLNVAFYPTDDWLEYRKQKHELLTKKEKLDQLEKMRNVTLHNSYNNLKMFARGMNVDIANCGTASLKSPKDIDYGGLNKFYDEFITKHYTVNVVKELWAMEIGRIQKRLDMLDLEKQGANTARVDIDLQLTALEREKIRKRQKLVMNHHYSTFSSFEAFEGGQFCDGYYYVRDDDCNAYIGDKYIYELHRKHKHSENGGGGRGEGRGEEYGDGYIDRGIDRGNGGEERNQPPMQAFDIYDARDLDMYDGRGETDMYDGASDTYEENEGGGGGNGRRGGRGRGGGGGNLYGKRQRW